MAAGFYTIVRQKKQKKFDMLDELAVLRSRLDRMESSLDTLQPQIERLVERVSAMRPMDFVDAYSMTEDLFERGG